MLLVLCYSSYSYSDTDIVNGTTDNAASVGYNWVMQNVLPQQAGLEVNNVIYRYTAVKETDADMVVTVQNEDALNPGQYIFREVDDWSQKPGKSIYKVVPQPNVTIDRWGDGSIVVEGEGTVENATVAYDYRYDPCFDPQSMPTCPGYVIPVPIITEPDLSELYDQNDKFIEDNENSKKIVADDGDEDERDRKKAMSQKKRERLEVALGAVNSALLTADAQAKHSALLALSIVPESYTIQTIPVTTYSETVSLDGGEIPDNTKARRVSFAQQLKHEQMVNLQYKQEND